MHYFFDLCKHLAHFQFELFHLALAVLAKEELLLETFRF